MKTVITTDSGINPLNHDNMVPGVIVSEDEMYYDTVKINKLSDKKAIDPKDILFRRIKGEKFSTSSPSYGDYVSIFSKLLDEGKEIVHLSMSSGISSGSVNMANNVISELIEDTKKEIYLVDTLTGGSGGPVIEAIANDLANKNLSAKEIKKELEKIKHKILSTYYISSADGFVASGRAPKAFKALNVVSVRHRVDIDEEGKLFYKRPYHGGIKKTSLKYVTELINGDNVENYSRKYISLLKMPLDRISIDEIRDYIKSLDYFENILEGDFLGTISAFGVRDQIGIGLLKK